MQANTTMSPRNEAGAARFDLYANIHTALRMAMCETLVATGRMDASDPDDVAGVLAQVADLLTLCEQHLLHENAFVHTAMEAVSAGSAQGTAHDHVAHERSLAELREVIAAIQRADAATRPALARGLYRRLATFVGENFAHMAEEESHNNAVLWAHFDDSQIAALEERIKASVPPKIMAGVMRWMVPSLPPAIRAAMLAGMKAHAPAEIYARVRALADEVLAPRDRAKLATALA